MGERGKEKKKEDEREGMGEIGEEREEKGRKKKRTGPRQ